MKSFQAIALSIKTLQARVKTNFMVHTMKAPQRLFGTQTLENMVHIPLTNHLVKGISELRGILAGPQLTTGCIRIQSF